MKRETRFKLKVYGISILLAELVGGLSALLTSKGMENFEKIEQPFLAPPPVVFPVVWTILFALMGISAAMIYLSPASVKKNHAIIIYVLQLAVNFFWSIIFFNLQAFGFAFFWLVLLWLLIFIMIYKFLQLNKTAAFLQIPYILWVTFAGYLTLSIWILNK